MQTEHLRFLLEIAHHGSINKAAEALHLPRTHLSRTLAHLEEMFGVSIFERLPRGVRPTDKGQYILARAEEALTILDEMSTHFIDQTPPVYPKYHDQYFFYCPAQMRSRDIVSQIIEAWQEQFPNAHLIHRTQRSRQISEQLSQHPNALALLLNAPDLTDIDLAQCEDFHFLPITVGSIVALTAANHPLAENKSISLKTLCSERLILISQTDDEPPLFYKLLSHYGTPNVKQVITGNMSLFYEMIATGRYVSLGIGSQLVNDDLVEIPIKEKPVVTGGLFFQPGSLKAFPLQRLAEMILQYYHREDLLPALGEK